MIAVNNMGHGHQKRVNASVKALQEGTTVNLAFQSPYYGQLARRVTQKAVEVIMELTGADVLDTTAL